MSSFCQDVLAGGSASWTFNLDGACPGSETYEVFARISAGSSPGFECVPYTLSYHFDAILCL